MIQLPKVITDSKEIEGLCKCRPICKSRRRKWKGNIQHTSAELLLENKPRPDCMQRVPMKVFPNQPCPLLAKSKRITIKQRDVETKNRVVRICQAPIDVSVDTSYLNYAEMAKRIGAWDAVKACCPFCACCACCACVTCEYQPRDGERATQRRADMRAFDARVKHEYQNMRVMYGQS